jgi:hypothetical protein
VKFNWSFAAFLSLGFWFASVSPARAAVFTLPTLDTTMTDPIFETLATSFAFRPLEPASDLGSVWGFYIGAGGSGSDASKVAAIFSEMSTSYVPNAELQLGIGLPKGFTIEGGFIPKINFQGTSLSKYGGTLKWTLTRSLLPKFPLSIAVRAGLAKASIDYTQPLEGGSVTVGYASTILESNLVISKFLGGFGFGIEPYLGFGVASQSSSLNATGTAELFGSSFPAGTESVSGSGTSTWLQAGLMLKLSVLAFTAEYDRMFGVSSWSGKATFRF